MSSTFTPDDGRCGEAMVLDAEAHLAADGALPAPRTTYVNLSFHGPLT
eukprot:gene28266-12555_t